MPAENSDLGHLVLDLSAIGIPTTPNTFALHIECDSMTKEGINDGDLVILEKRQCEPRSGEIVAALVDQHVTLTRFVIENGKPILRPENPNHNDTDPDDNFEIQGIAIGLIRKL